MNPVKIKFEEIHKDLEANVTKIYLRRDLLTGFDLVSHSVIQFSFQGDVVRKGWVEGLVIGDTRCGKSESIDRLINHYKVGELVTGENATYAGLVGGMQQTQKTWSITWGKLPLNDRRMIVIDELSGLPQETISRMSGVRSSGVAEIIKIQTERTLSRVRILWMSNPRGKRPIAAFNSGLDAIQELIGNPEDIARFDFALTMATAEVPLAIINAAERPNIGHRFNAYACNRLVYWAWSRRADQVVWTPGSEKAVLDGATWLSRKYIPPLVEGAEQRIKVARLAVAAAARVYSSSSDGHNVIVRPDHVEFVVDYLDEIYSKPSMALDILSKAKIQEATLESPQAVQDKLDGYSTDFRNLLAESGSFNISDLQDFAGISKTDAEALASFFVRKRCTRKGRFGYYKLPAFIRFLRHFRPAYQHPPEYDPAGGGVEPAPEYPEAAPPF